MTTIEHTHTEFTTKDEMSDFKVTVTNMMTQLSQANLAANARVDRLEARMDRLEEEMPGNTLYDPRPHRFNASPDRNQPPSDRFRHF